MSTKSLPTILFAAATALALSACAHSSTPSTTGAPSAPSSGGPTASQDPATAPMSGIIFAAADDGIDTTVTTVRAIDPQSGTITATRTFTFPSEYLSAPGYMCEYMQCYSPDFSRMIVANNDGENEKVAVVSTDGTCLTIDQGTIYSTPGTPLAQTTPEDQTLLVSNWTTVSLPGLESTHTIEGWLAVSPDGTQMALYASPKDTYSDLSLPIFVAPVAGGDATQVTTTTEDVPGVVRILGWTK